MVEQGERHKKWLPILCPGLDVVFVGFNPSPVAAATGHYYANPRNRFWELLFASGIVPVRLGPEDDATLVKYRAGLTDVVARPTPQAGDLTSSELKDGGEAVRRRLQKFRPKVAAYTGKGVYRAVASGPTPDYGVQETCAVPDVMDFVLPSPSGRSGLPWKEKVMHYRALAELLIAMRKRNERP